MMKWLSLCTLCLFSFSAVQLSPPKLFGKYGKIATGEYICLELFESNAFSMSISACDKDTYIDGQYTYDDEAIYLTSNEQPGIKILNVASENAVDETTSITLESPDALLIAEIKVRINKTGKWHKPNKDRQVLSKENVAFVELSLQGMTTTREFEAAQAQAHTIKFAFEHLHDMAMDKQKWMRIGKNLIFKDDNGTQVTLKKSRKCWFDYKFKDEK